MHTVVWQRYFLNDLKIGIFSTFFMPSVRSAVQIWRANPVTIFFLYMDRVDSDVVAVKDTKSCSDDLPSFQMEAQIVSLGMARYIEGTTARWIGFVIPFRSKDL